MEATFWAAIGVICYAYLGYPIVLTILSLFRSRPVKKGDTTPPVSFIITAHNEERRIRQKIENTLAQSYPKELMEIIVASDCSTDRTDTVTTTYRAQRVKLVRSPQRKGKEYAQKLAVEQASGAILIFSDVATVLSNDGVRNIVRNFNDPSVGCVSSEDRILDKDGRISGEGAYVKYEMLLRRLESKVNTVVGLSGSFFAARREVCRTWATDLQSDFNTLLNSVQLGLRGVSDPETIGCYPNISDERKESERKVRTLVRGMSVLMRRLPLLNPFTYGLFAWQLFSHKICRWMVPFAMLFAFVTNLLLIDSSLFYCVLLAGQGVFYLSGVLGMQLRSCKIISDLPLIKVPAFFVMVNLSILRAWVAYLRGGHIVSWEPSTRDA